MFKKLENKNGIALPLFLALLLMITLVGILAITNSLTNIDVSGNRGKGSSLVYKAEAGVEKAFVRIRDYYDHDTTVMTSFPSDTFVLGGDSVGYYTLCDSASMPNCGSYISSRIQSVLVFRDLTAWGTGYRIISKAWSPATSASAKISQSVAVYHIPVFQFSAIYDTFDLEISPEQSYSDSCILNGRIHTNKNLYVETYRSGTNPYTRLFLGDNFSAKSSVTAKGKIFHGHYYSGTWPASATAWGAGDDSIRIKDFNGNYQRMKATFKSGLTWLDHNYYLWIDSSLSKWGGTVQDTSHQIAGLYLKMVMPEDSTQPYNLIKRKNLYPTSFDSLADLRIYTNPNDAVLCNNLDTAWYDATGTGNYTSYASYLICVKKLGELHQVFTYDYRERKPVDAVSFDIHDLNDSQLWPPNGIVYITRTGTNPNTLYAVMIINATELHDNLTIVSDRPVYIVGNFNTINKKRAAIIADAVTIISNPACTTWTADTTLTLRPAASNITVNACIMTGNRPTTNTTTPKRYSGGLWNLVRLLEDWTNGGANNRSLTINGSMACFWRSQVATSVYRFPPGVGFLAAVDSVYKPPTLATGRPLVLSWDSAILDGFPNFQPPGAPVLNYVIKTRRSVEEL